MRLYHGTTYDRFEKIFSLGKLEVTTKELSHYPSEGHAKTRVGYVYLTDHPLAALDFANRCWTNDNKSAGKRCLCVFEININEDELEEDVVEENLQTSTIEDAAYYQVNRPVDYADEVVRVSFYKFPTTGACDEYTDQTPIEDIKWSDDIHKKLYNEISKRWNGDNGVMG